MACKNNKSIVFFITTMFLLISCKSAPTAFDRDVVETAPLSSGASFYVFVDLNRARPILDELPLEEMLNKHARQMLERTDFLAAALFPSESEKNFQLAMTGDYPSFGARIAFRFNRNWKRQRSEEGVWWHSNADRLSVALDSRHAFVKSFSEEASQGGLNPVAAAGIQAPEGFGGFSRGAVFSCWLENPDHMMNRMLSASGIPLRVPAENIFIILGSSGGAYEAVIRLQFETTMQARGITAALTLAGNFAHGNIDPLLAQIFFANPPVQNDRNLDIKSALLTESQIAQFLKNLLDNPTH